MGCELVQCSSDRFSGYGDEHSSSVEAIIFYYPSNYQLFKYINSFTDLYV